MLKKFSLGIMALFLLIWIGCKSDTSRIKSEKFDYNYFDQNCTDPYLKFKPVLDESMLQCPTSSFDPSCSRDYGDFDGFTNQYFYYQNCDLVFYMCGDHNRSELRFQDEFYMSDEVNKTLEAVVEPIPISSDEITFLQLHGEHIGVNKPILRAIIYKGKLKLVVFDGNDYIWKDLGDYTPHFMYFKLVAGYNMLYVYKDGKLELNATINYPDKCYYKLGTYSQRPGCGRSIFKYIKTNF